MKFSTRSEYGLRAMVELAKNYGRGFYSLSEVAKKERISFDYLGKILGKLKKQGLVKTERGVAGGYALGKRPEKISVWEIISVLEGSLTPKDCFLCRKVPCDTKIVWDKIKQSLATTFGSLTLGDLIGKN